MLAQSRAAVAALGIGPGDEAQFHATGAGPFAHLHDGPQAFEQGAVPAERRGPGGAQRLDRGGAAEIEAEFGFGGAGPGGCGGIGMLGRDGRPADARG